MQAIILAAGKSTRTYPLTVRIPKPLLKVANRTILEHNLQQLQGLADEAVIVIGSSTGSRIRQCVGSSFGKIKIRYAAQKQQLGTGNALLAAEKFASGRFIVMMGDDLYGSKDIRECLKHRCCLLAKEVDDVSSFGAVGVKGNSLSAITEKPKAAKGLANCGLYVLDKSIFHAIRKTKKSGRGEVELTDAVVQLSKKEDVAVEKASFWIPVTYPWSLLAANEALLGSIASDVQATVEKGVTIRGKVKVGKNSLLRSGAYIEGPVVIGEGCDIGPNCYIRPFTSIGNNCRIGNAVEIKNSILMDNVAIGHLSYVGDSIIGNSTNIGAGFIVANLRHDNGEVKSMVNGRLVSTGRKKFGTIIADSVKTGIRTSVYPGRKIWPNKTTLPGEIVRKDVN